MSGKWRVKVSAMRVVSAFVNQKRSFIKYHGEAVLECINAISGQSLIDSIAKLERLSGDAPGPHGWTRVEPLTRAGCRFPQQDGSRGESGVAGKTSRKSCTGAGMSTK
jgi:hypothetical protein